jgi:hypothetical protein
VAAELERQGIATVCLQLLREVAQRVRPPRALFVAFRHGYPLDAPNDPGRQHRVLEAALRLFENAGASPPVLETFRGEDGSGAARRNGSWPVRAERGMMTHRGGCHCGRVRFEVVAPTEIEVDECSCSICSRVGYLHLIVPKSRFKLIAGAEFLTTYTFHTGTAKHAFCRVCGVKAFYVPRSHPDGYSVNARCIDPGTVERVTIKPFDGANWEANVSKLEPFPPD